jgi:hypothetical protein
VSAVARGRDRLDVEPRGTIAVVPPVSPLSGCVSALGPSGQHLYANYIILTVYDTGWIFSRLPSDIADYLIVVAMFALMIIPTIRAYELLSVFYSTSL